MDRVSSRPEAQFLRRRRPRPCRLRRRGRRHPGVPFGYDAARGSGTTSRPHQRADRRGRRVQPGPRSRPDRARLPLCRVRPRRPAAALGRGVHPPSLFGRAHLCGAPAGRRDDRRGTAPRRRRGHRRHARRRQGRVRRRDRAARRRRHEADARQLPEPGAGPGGELPEDGPGDGRGPPGHLHQARRPAPQPPHDRVPRQAEAGAEGPRGARGVRAARAPARDPPDEVGARGPRVRGAPPAQVHRDQGDGERAARRPRGTCPRGGIRPAARARQGRHPGRHLRARQALLLHLRQDGQEGQGVQRDLRPHRDARHRRALRRRRGRATATARWA